MPDPHSDLSDDNPYQSPADPPSVDLAAKECVPSSPIQLRGDVTVDDYLSIYRLAMWKTRTLWFRYATRLFMGLGSIYFLYVDYQQYQAANWGGVKFTSLAAAWLVGSLLLIFLLTRRKIKRHLTAINAKMGDAPTLLDKAGLHMHGQTISSDFAWEAFDSYRTNGPLLVLYLTYPKIYMGVLEKHASSPEEWERLQQLVASRLIER